MANTNREKALSNSSDDTDEKLAANSESLITDDLDALLAILPPPISKSLKGHDQLDQLIEVILDLGRLPEARFFQCATYLSDEPVSPSDINYCTDRT